MSARSSLLVILAIAAPLAAQKPATPKPDKVPGSAAGSAPGKTPAAPPETGDIAAFRDWLKDYKDGALRLVKDDKIDDAAVADLDARMQKLAQWNTLVAAQALFEAASVDPQPKLATSSTEAIDFYRETRPWLVHTMAAKHLRAMTGDGILTWLLQMLNTPGIRALKKNQDQLNAAAVLRVLGGHPSTEAQLELVKACRSMPTELRVHAVNAMAKDPTVELVPTLIELLHDPEPNVRIAACNSIGQALQPHVDETLGKQPDDATIALRDSANQGLAGILERDGVWQVRSAAAFALAIQRCKVVIPLLIRGLEVELLRKKDPWAMDLRLHKLLEGLTGQKVTQGDLASWKQFWAREGALFAVRPENKATPPVATSKYAKFFDLEVESDRVLFVVDFSGSMAEAMTVKGGGGTAARQPGASGTKAEIVVAELKKLIMSLPDGAMVNVVVFGDDVRMWRQEGGKPALVKLDDDARDDLVGKFLDSLRPNGRTNLHDALDAALGFGGRGLQDKYYAAGFDTLYVITDGAPTAGAVTDKEEILRRVRECNRLRRITIQCVTFGDKNDTAFLAAMAEQNGGRHIHVE